MQKVTDSTRQPQLPYTVPRWLARRIRKRLGTHGQNASEVLINAIHEHSPVNWLEHFGMDCKRRSFIVEPYPHDGKLEAALRFGETIGVPVRFSKHAWHHPDAVRVEFLQPGEGVR